MPSLQIIDQDNDDNTKVEKISQPLCYICQEKASNYICPRCNLRYCSLPCYKHQKHTSCTETFYKENVMAEMNSLDADQINKKSIQKILRKFEAENDQQALGDEQNPQQQQYSSYDDTSDDAMKTMEQRFADMDIANTDASMIWDMLSPQEQHEFQALMKMDTWQGLDLPEYEPWWITQASKVIDLDDDDDDDDNTITDIPALPTAIPALSDIMKSPPAPHLIFHLVHVLMTYTYLARQTMGDLADDLDYGMRSVSCLSQGVLFSSSSNDNAQLYNLNDVCTDLRRQINDSTTAVLDITLLKDVEHLLTNGKDYAVRALGELYQLLDFASKEKQLFVSPSVKITRKKVGLAARKAYFFMVYTNHLKQQEQEQQLDLLVASIRNEHKRLQMDQDVFEAQRKVARNAMVEQKQKSRNNITGDGGSKIVELE
ncbi:hypothetical protein BC941DRAFT_467852 [Chlamydoabsidia padenii]|nr:hypothetical protein BC941DRAFT_467852 [Chlamydoabsidia padenii]